VVLLTVADQSDPTGPGRSCALRAAIDILVDDDSAGSDDAMTDRSPDPYAVLGVARGASRDEISHAYRAMLRKHHPDTREDDTAGGADAALRDVVAAYDVLRDPTRRAAYDRRLVESAAQVPYEAPTVPVAVRAHPTPIPPIVAGPVRWERPASRRR
jgi:DnaJ domain